MVEGGPKARGKRVKERKGEGAKKGGVERRRGERRVTKWDG